MNEKDHKAIAEIIKDYFDNINTVLALSGYVKNLRDLLVEKLADYFEKENPPHIQYFKHYGFNRTQFLKDCGVK